MDRLRTLCVLGTLAGLAACGGGGSAAYVPTTSTTCTLPLQYANGSSSGMGITPQATSSDRHFNACNMTQLQTARLTVCINHPNLSEVSGQLRLSGNSVLALSANSGAAVGTSCLAQSGGATTVREFTLASGSLASTAFSSGPWSVTLSDALPDNNQSGYFVAWALELQGLR
jgi:hypothetical protein